MPIAKVETQLNTPELEQFVSQVMELKSRCIAPSLSKEETELLLKINQGIPVVLQKKYDSLASKGRAETLMLDEYRDLLRLSALIEALDTKCVEYMANLSSSEKKQE